MQIRAAKGTRDILPGDVEAWQRVEGAARDAFELYGYREIRTPVFEATDLFQKSTGADTDIVTKEMYTFSDRGGRSLTLRPEGTPGVVRAALEHGLLGRGEPLRLYYVGPMFRYERPQKGRYRQFAQIGAELFGSSHPAGDAELMAMVHALFTRLGIDDAALEVNSVGHTDSKTCRGAYREALRAALLPKREQLCEDCRRRLDLNPLRILDCKVPGCAPIREAAPSIQEHLCPDCRAHFEEVREYLGILQVPHRVNPGLVRGLDYYTRTTFEFIGGGLGAQNALCGGGRYDDLVASMGGPVTPAIGFAIGSDRLVMVVHGKMRSGDGAGCPPVTDLYIVHLGGTTLKEAVAAAAALRSRGIVTWLDPGAKDLKKQMSRAGASGARFALILGDRELEKGVYSLKNLADGNQREFPAREWDAIEREVANVR